MRFWHKDLIEVLPRQQLVSQWREIIAVLRKMNKSNSLDLLVKQLVHYNESHVKYYTNILVEEFICRGYNFSDSLYDEIMKWEDENEMFLDSYVLECDCQEDLFKEWHNDRYLLQCYHNLQEKFDNGGINIEDWMKIHKQVRQVLKSKWEVIYHEEKNI